MAPSRSVPLKRHWKASGAVPVAITCKVTFVPASAAWLAGCSVMAGGPFTVVTLVAVLLAALESGVGEATVRVLVISPATVGVTTTVKLLPPPLGMVPTLQKTFPPRLTQPGEAETNVTLAGKASVSITLEAEAGPRLVTVSV